jgi:hypothetical protein
MFPPVNEDADIAKYISGIKQGDNIIISGTAVWNIETNVFHLVPGVVLTTKSVTNLKLN